MLQEAMHFPRRAQCRGLGEPGVVHAADMDRKLTNGATLLEMNPGVTENRIVFLILHFFECPRHFHEQCYSNHCAKRLYTTEWHQEMTILKFVYVGS